MMAEMNTTPDRMQDLKRLIQEAISRDDLASARSLLREATPRPAQPGTPTRSIEIDALAQVPLLSDLSRAELLALIGELELRWVGAGERILSEGGPGTSVFAIAYGGDADLETLRRIAEATNAQVYDASDATTISRVFTAVVSNF